MLSKPKDKVIAIYGPTISEKTGLAVNIAKYLWGKYGIEPELVSADSRKVYKDLVIGQMALYSEYAKKIKVRCYKNVDSLNQTIGLHEYKTMADEAIEKIISKGNFPIIYGGGSVYISSVLENWNVSREKSHNYKKEFGKGHPKYQSIILIPQISKPVLFKKIKEHAKKSINSGILEEVKKLVEKYKIDPLAPPTKNMLFKIVEYREFLEYCYQKQIKLEKLKTIDIKKIEKRIVDDLKEMARGQIRWFKKMKGKKYFVRSWAEARNIVDSFIKS